MLITGGSGFIGGRLVGLLYEGGHDVVYYNKAARHESGCATIIADMRDAQRLAESVRGCEAIIQLAAEYRDEVTPVSLYDQVNVGGAENLVAAAQKAGWNCS